MEAANMELERLKSATARSSSLKNKEWEMRYEKLTVQLNQAEKQAHEDRKALLGGCTPQRRKELESEVAGALQARDAALQARNKLEADLQVASA
jgi:hypothetical protein